jgi:fatty acid synthase
MSKKETFITGFSCRFPESDSPHEFFQNLLNQRDMVTGDTRRWKEKIEDLPERSGKIKQNLSFFDNRFFNVHGKQAEKMDPQLRLLLEVSYEALVDAGYSLSELKGSKTGVYVGACNSDAQKGWLQERENISGYEHTGCAMSMLANRLSFVYDLHGPSETIDTACSSSLVAFHRAIADLEAGVCECAIVGGSSIILWPHTSYAFHKLKMLSPEGACKSFDQSANGFVRSEGIAVIVLTTNRMSKHSPYAKVLGSGVNNGGWNSSGITFPNGQMQKTLYRAVCERAHIEPKEVEYIEAHGTGTVAGDGEELSAIYEVYGKENPHLIIGSVKSNMGHCEGASGLAGVIKLLLCFDREILVPNLHLQNPNEKLKEMRVMTQPLLHWKCSIAGVSSFGFGGTNAHIILQKYSPPARETLDVPFSLTLLAHRTKEGLYRLKKSCPKGQPILNSENKQKLPFREVLELPDDPEVSSISDSSDQIYIACSGNGSQWNGMGIQFYDTFHQFKNIIDLCGKAIGMDLISILRKGGRDALENTVSLVAIQIGLIELIQSFGLDRAQIGGFFGHSAGEIVCSYLDHLTSLQQTMDIAYVRGSIANQTGDQGAMASIGLTKEVMHEWIVDNQLQERVCIACINSPRNVTISGYKEDVLALVRKAEEKNIFARPLETYGKAYHSFFFKERRKNLEQMLKEKLGDQKWLRTEKWGSSILNHDSNLFDFQYHVDAVIEPVDFIRTLHKIPQNGTVLEIGPHPILKTLIKDNRPDLKYACLMKKNTSELETFKEGLGKLWKYGIFLQMPVRWERPPLEIRDQLVSWDHTEEYPVPQETDFSGGNRPQSKVVFHLSEEKDRYLKGHVIDGKVILPATSYLYVMWETFRKNHSLSLQDPITYSFTDFEILQAVQVETESKLELFVHCLGNQYELSFKDEIIAKVKIDRTNRTWKIASEEPKEKSLFINADHFYRIVDASGYEYDGSFKVIHELKSDFENNINEYLLNWTGNWIAFLDGVLQCFLLPPKNHMEGLRVPVRIRSIEINPSVFLQHTSDSQRIRALSDFDIGSVTLPGIEVAQMETKSLARRKEEDQKIDIKQANDVLYFGRNQASGRINNEYGILFNKYAIQLCSKLIEREGLSKTGHYKKILKAFDAWGKYSLVDEVTVASYRVLPEGIGIRILENCYREDRRDFIEQPMVVTTQHPEYGRFYLDDPLAGHCDRSFVLKFLSVVRENIPRSELNILEIGTGTGGFTRIIAPYLLNDRYVITDLTETSQMIGIAHFKPEYKRFNLNEYDSYKILKTEDVDLILASNSLHTGQSLDRVLESIYTNLKDGSFLIFYEATSPFGLALFAMDARLWSFEDEREYGLWISQESWLKKLKEKGFEVISYVADEHDTSTFFLVRKPLRLKLSLMNAPSIHDFDQWSARIKDCSGATLLVAKTLEQSGVFGFIRSLNRELEESHLYALKTDEDLIPQQLEHIERLGLRINLLQNGRLGTVCLSDLQYTNRNESPWGYHALFSSLGDLSSSCWANTPPHQETICSVKYAALNFKDVMMASGKIPREAFSGFTKEGNIGFEFSGCDQAGNRYMGIANRGIANQVAIHPHSVIPIPDSMSYEEAATIPVVYATAYYALFDCAHIQPGQTVLIHAGTGGVGQAAIRVCLSLGCQIFTTCHQNKKSFLKELFPELDSMKILDSRSTEFEKQILKQTKGRGVDVILNSLADDKLQASIRCLASGGHFLEIGKYDLMRHTPLDMNILLKNTTINGIDLDQIFSEKLRFKRVLSQLEEGIRQGIVQPLPRHVFDHNQIEDAFRFMGSAKHMGKVLIDMQNMTSNNSKSPFHFSFYHDPKEDGYFLITGGLGGFGLALLQWLFGRGVKKFLITSRRGVTSGEQQRLLHLLRSKGAEIIVSTKDVAKEEEVRELIDIVQGKIGAVFHLAMILEDGLFKNMTKDKWEKTVEIKAKGAIYLDRFTRIDSVKHFIVFSSLTSLIGNIGQSNYAFGNSVMEEVCANRSKEGYPGLAIQWGLIGNAGFVANNTELCRNLKQHYEPIKMVEALQFIEDVMVNDVNSSCAVYCAQAYKACEEKTEALTFDQVMGQICNIVKMDLLGCNQSDTLEHLGIDSLQVVEIQTVLIKAFHEVLPLKKISAMKTGELKALIEGKIGLEKIAHQAEDIPKPEDMLHQPLIQSIHREKLTSDAVYLFLGYGIKVESLNIAKTEKFNVAVAHWHTTTDIHALVQAIDDDIKKNQYKKVILLSHSAGYQVAKVVMAQSTQTIDRLVAVSLVNERIIHNIVGEINIESIPDALFEKGYRDSAFFVPDHLSIPQIKQQTILLSKLLKYKNIKPNTVFVPRKDSICERWKDAIEVSGDHQINSLNIEEIYEHL